MGGVGSGRHWHWNAKATTSEYLRLDVRRLEREGLLEPGSYFGWFWKRDGEPVGDIRIRAEFEQIHLNYRTRSHGGDWEQMDYPVRLLSQPCHFGGNRRWFACPARGCGRQVAILYGGGVFACRHCHQLAYPSQREKEFQRYSRRADKIRERLGWEIGLDVPFGSKPKGMHWRTFDQLVTELAYWEDASDMAFTHHCEMVLQKTTRAAPTFRGSTKRLGSN
ncbi:hypothetical protein AVO45_09125 [Ruegeria marisrubri]|uniref:Uncharacterized protein n=1 Tax=Ruegeria marisrubri TaxID=1685379 RepID=A0A0X3TXK9_9RHOB|nr:hypothetical protein [Ruegeria marisrubri]KUJ78110.1 hypothetical protein AVO45_09125 [Ruegeria marisrubri]